MSLWALVGFLAIVISIVALAIRSGLGTRRNPIDFYLGGRSQSAWRSAVASFAAAESGFVFLGLVGMAYTQGFVTAWILVGVLYGYLGTWLYMAPRLRRVSECHNALTVPQVIGLSAGKMRTIVVGYGALLLGFALMLYVAVQFYAIGKSLHFVAGWPAWLGTVAGAMLITAYSMVGGMRSIAYADLMQGIMMVASLAMMSTVLAFKIVGGGALIDQLYAIKPELVDPFGGARGWDAALLVFYYSIIGLGLTGAPHYLRKFMATRPEISHSSAGYIATASVFTLFSCAIFTGLAGRILLGSVNDPESVILILGDKIFIGIGGLLFGFLVAGLFSAMGSTADAQLLETAATLTEDGGTLGLHRFISSSPRRTILIISVLGVVCAVLGTETVFNRTLTAWSLLGATFGPQLLLILSKSRLSGPGILSGMVAAGVTVLVWEFGSPWSRLVYSLAPGFIIGGVTTWVISRLTLASTAGMTELSSGEDAVLK